MNNNKKPLFILPISVDLGAAHTGVYSAFYPAGSPAKDIERCGTVYNLEKSNYTLMMKDRTAKRHQRRGFDRRQLAKRLFRVIWEKHWQLPWSKDTAQTIGFLMNRRGFTFLTEEYSSEILSDFPPEVWKELPESFKALAKKEDFPPQNVHQLILSWAKVEKVEEALKYLTGKGSKNKKILQDLFFYGRCKTLKAYCEKKENNETTKNEEKKLQNLSSWVVKRWQESGVLGFDQQQNTGNINVVELLEKSSYSFSQIIVSIPHYTKEEEEAKKSIWNFSESKFELDKVDFDDADQKKRLKNHLFHLSYALYSVSQEIKSGAKYRTKYFEEVNEILETKKHRHGYLKRFCEELHGGQFSPLNKEKLTYLLGHISNLELKPLRKYFNDEEHKAGDYWDEERLQKIFAHWILREWRVVLKKNPSKDIGKPQDYKALCEKWAKNKDGLLAFWLKENPEQTVPPYQNNNNRRPPRCQSLLLNPKVLDSDYPEWKDYLSIIKKLSPSYLDDFEESLKEMTSSKNKSYFSEDLTGDFQKDSQRLTHKNLHARVFQFLLDRRKDTDPLKLNEIYSRVKKIRQLKNQNSGKDLDTEEAKLEKVLEASQLPESLKTTPHYSTAEIFPQGTFLHLICRYYKMRQRARDGRIFIHPEYRKSEKRGYEKTSRFEERGQLLSYCNLKPRQKKYQSFSDVAGIFQVDRNVLLEKTNSTEDAAVEAWLKSFHGLPTLCQDSAKAQKKYRGNLKTLLLSLDKNHKDKNSKDLMNLKEKAEKMSLEIAEALFGKEQKEEKSQGFSSVFSFAQLYNVAFSERGGNSKNCPLCSMDNSFRMVLSPLSGQEKELGAKAQRLPAIPTRIIDGAVMRMARILSTHIVKDHWEKAKKKLEAGCDLRIPIITELNRFNFEPSLAMLKSKPVEKKSEDKDDFYEKKVNRIKSAGKGLCPYIKGESPGENGELDHIIPQSSRWGTLNDEANLIYSSKRGNQKKKENVYYLRDLNPEYKKALFGEKTDPEIEAWIEGILWNFDKTAFSFGRYQSFINLDENERKAFRHALFLEEKHPLREQVLSAINNQTRALVNGTQRYFAEVLANEFHKKALSLHKEKHISFDFFGVEALNNSRGKGIKDLRELYETLLYDKLEKYTKDPGVSQLPYSHLMDAQIAFLLTVDRHRNEGSFQIDIPTEFIAFPPHKDGVLSTDNLFTHIWVPPEDMKPPVEVIRRKPQGNFTQHRSFTRDTFYADHYLPILMRKNKEEKVEVRAGFSWKNSGLWKMDKKNLGFLKRILPFCSQTKYSLPENGAEMNSIQEIYNWLLQCPLFSQRNQKNLYLTIDKKALHAFWVDDHNTKTGKPLDDFFKFCYTEMGYRTEKKQIKGQGKEQSALDFSILNPQSDKYKTSFIKKFGESEITMPFLKDWGRLKEEWENHELQEEDVFSFLKTFFIRLKKDMDFHPHQRARKVFSLPVLTKEGKFLIRKRDWTGNPLYQIGSDSDSRSMNNKLAVSVKDSNDSLAKSLNPWARSKSMVKLQKENFVEGEVISPYDWYLLDEETNPFPEFCEKIWMRIDDTTAPTFCIKLAKDGKDTPSRILLNSLLKHGFQSIKAKKAKGDQPATLKKEPQEVMEEFWKEKVTVKKRGDIFCYKASKASNYSKERKEAFKTAKKSDIPS